MGKPKWSGRRKRPDSQCPFCFHRDHFAEICVQCEQIGPGARCYGRGDKNERTG